MSCHQGLRCLSFFCCCSHKSQTTGKQLTTLQMTHHVGKRQQISREDSLSSQKLRQGQLSKKGNFQLSFVKCRRQNRSPTSSYHSVPWGTWMPTLVSVQEKSQLPCLDYIREDSTQELSPSLSAIKPTFPIAHCFPSHFSLPAKGESVEDLGGGKTLTHPRVMWLSFSGQRQRPGKVSDFHLR